MGVDGKVAHSKSRGGVPALLKWLLGLVVAGVGLAILGVPLWMGFFLFILVGAIGLSYRRARVRSSGFHDSTSSYVSVAAVSGIHSAGWSGGAGDCGGGWSGGGDAGGCGSF